MAELLGRVDRVTRSGSGYNALCPGHEDKSPSLSINLGTKGGIVLKCHTGCAVEKIVSSLGLQMLDLAPEGIERTREATQAPKSAKVTAYTYQNADGSTFARKERHPGKSFRWSRPDETNPEKWISGTAGEIPLYRLPELIGAPIAETVIVCEGEKDADRLASHGYVVTTTPNGAGAKWRESDSVHFAGRKVAVIADDDEPGRRKAESTAAGLRDIAAAVAVVTLPNPTGRKGFDASDFMEDGGTVADLNRAIDGAFTRGRLPVEVITPEDLENRVLNLWEKGDEPGAYLGWPLLPYRPRLGEMTIVTGAPGSGKSTFVDDAMIRTSCADDTPGRNAPRWRWLIYSPEQFPPARHTSKVLQKISGRPFAEGPTQRMSKDEIRNLMPIFNRHFTILDPTFDGCTLDRILEIGHDLNRDDSTRIQGLLLDPYNVLAATSRKAESEHEFINLMLAKIRRFAQSERVHVVVVAHPTKMKKEPADHEYPVVRPWDISGSGHWFNHADAILSVWRAMTDEVRIRSGETEIHVQKIRFQPECGSIGMTKLYFDKVTGRYTDAPDERSTRREWQEER